MQRAQFAYPAKPFWITQSWGIRNPIYDPLGFLKHNGIDFRHGADKKLYYPDREGEVVKKGFQPEGAGYYVVINTQKEYSFDDRVPGRNEHTFMHLEFPSHLEVGDKVRRGDLVGIPGNTGLSTGPHTHWRPRRFDRNNTFLDGPEANYSYDPMPYMINEFAQDQAAYFKMIDLLTSLKDKLFFLKVAHKEDV